MKRKFTALLIILSMMISLFYMPVKAKNMAGADSSVSYNSPSKNSNGDMVWDCVWFGNYWQNDTNGDGIANTSDEKEPIKWRVLYATSDDLFIISENLLDAKCYNTTFKDITWEKSTIRSWLNGYDSSYNNCGENYTNSGFINDAFSNSEISAIKTTTVNNSFGQGLFETNGGRNTTDKLFLLSYKETITGSYGFSTDHDVTRIANVTKFAVARGVKGYSRFRNDDRECGKWWLRSPASSSARAMEVTDDGSNDDYRLVNYNKGGVRPALHISPSSSLLLYAGTVCSDGTVDEISHGKGGIATKPSGPYKNPVWNNDDTVTWDCVWFGYFLQNDTNGDEVIDDNDEKEPIKWRVLSSTPDDCFLISDKILDWKVYTNNYYGYVGWPGTNIYEYLNGSFLSNAFSDLEQQYIKTTEVEYLEDYEEDEYFTQGCKLFLLNKEESENADYGFSVNYYDADEARTAQATAYAKQRGAKTKGKGKFADNSPWWLMESLLFTSKFGDLKLGEEDKAKGLRPVLHVLPSTVLSYAGTVCSNGKTNEVAPEKRWCTVSYDSSGGTTFMSTSVRSGNTITSPGTPRKGGYVFAGWYQDETLTKQWEFKNTVAHDMTLYAKWSKDKNPPKTKATYDGPIWNNDDTVAWDCVWFGSYWQNDTNGDGKADKNDEKEPIKWRVLSASPDDLFLVSDMILDAKPYEKIEDYVSWDTSSIRSWLNGYDASKNIIGKDYSNRGFINLAFTKSEQSAIKTVEVKNDKSEGDSFSRHGGNDTQDKIFLLSYKQVNEKKYGFSDNIFRTDKRDKAEQNAKMTHFSWTQGLTGDKTNGSWWLRTPFYQGTTGYGYCVDPSEGFYRYEPVRNAGVRPAMHVAPSSIKSYAGTICSDEVESLFEFHDVGVGKKINIKFGERIEKIDEIIVCGENVIDANISEETQSIVIEGMKPGFATVTVYNKKGKVIGIFPIRVDQ